MTQWVHRYFVIATVAAVAGCRNLCQQLGDGGAAEQQAVGVPLNASGDKLQPITSYGASTAATEPHRRYLTGVENAGGLAGVTYWRLDNLSGLLMATNDANSQNKIGQAFTWNDALNSLALKVAV